MFKTTGIILLCMTFIFATSGNSRGLIFKNLAKTEHELKVKNDFGMPAAEEIFEQVTEKKPPTSILKFPYFPIEQRDCLARWPTWHRRPAYRWLVVAHSL